MEDELNLENLDADLALLEGFPAEEEVIAEEAPAESGLDYYYNMMLPELQEGNFTSDEKLEFVIKVL
jgi:hypothetical protein